MDFAIPEELSQLRDSFGSFLEREVRPVEDRHRSALQSNDWTEQMDADAVAVRKASAAAGFYACYLPEDVGGSGVSTLGTTMLVEDTGRSGLRFAQAAMGPPNPAAPSPVLLQAQPHVRDAYLPSLASGDTTMCFALTEPEAGSDAQSIRTKATKTETGWLINGTKHYITNAEDAAVCLLFAVNDAEKRANGGITAFLVPRDQYRVVKQQTTVSDTHPYEIVLEDAQVPDDHVIGEVGYGFFTAMNFLNAGRAYIGAQCVGMAQFCLDYAVEHARQRTAFGRPIGKNQGVSFQLADTAVDIEAGRWMTYRLAWLVDEHAAGRADLPILQSSMVKLFDTEMAFQAADRAMQVLGGQGLMIEVPIERIWRFIRILRIVEGASEIQRMIIARSLGL